MYSSEIGRQWKAWGLCAAAEQIKGMFEEEK